MVPLSRIYRKAMITLLELGVILTPTALWWIVMDGLGLPVMSVFLELALPIAGLGLVFLMLGGIEVVMNIHQHSVAVRGIKSVLSSANISGQFTPAMQPAYLLADSMDREVLAAIREIGSDILDIEDHLASSAVLPAGQDTYRVLAKLRMLGLIMISEKWGKVFLTSAGIDALNTPAIMYTTRIPDQVWNYVFSEKVHLWNQEWGEVVISATRALEAAMKERVRVSVSARPELEQEIMEMAAGKPVETWSAGNLLGALRKIGVVRSSSLEDVLAGEIIKTRNLVHDKGREYTFGPGDADRCDTCLSILLRSWYGPR
ncbi:MAG: hypothetical protein QXS20_00290 [Candidatus Thorarchaeota archaeon]